MTLEYFEFYRGNLRDGFDVVSGKKTDDHSFILSVPKTANLTTVDITNSDVDFIADEPEKSRLTQFTGMWRPMNFQWEMLADRFAALTTEWRLEYTGAILENNVEWGLKFKNEGNTEVHHYYGFNDFPENFAEVEQWLLSYGSGKIR
jgi:hypothetical protein